MKYILRTEVLYRRVRSVLDRAPSVLAASEDLQRITAAYKASCEAEERGAAPVYTSLAHLVHRPPIVHSRAGDKDKFLEYLVAIELQAKRPPPAPKLPIPDDGMTSFFLERFSRALRHTLKVMRLFRKLSIFVVVCCCCCLPRATVLIEVFMYLSDRELLGNVGRVSKWMYRLSRDNALWSKRMHLVYPTVAYAFRFVTAICCRHTVLRSA